jgi:regulator of sirC expression with transglutaminase-like and TPR domain
MAVLTAWKAGEAVFCQPDAYKLFIEQLPSLHTNASLLRAAIAVSMHALDDVDPERIEQRLEIMSLRVRERSPSRSPSAIIANLHDVLFEEEDFRGNMERYYNALNSYVPAVLNTRRGIPVVLSLLYKIVGEWAGLTVHGVNAPGHFMVRVRCENSWAIVDPFFGGQLLKRDEAFQRLERIAGKGLPHHDQLLATPSHQQWLVRILGNLRQIFAAEGRRDDLAAMTEMSNALTAFQASRAA